MKQRYSCAGDDVLLSTMRPTADMNMVLWPRLEHQFENNHGRSELSMVLLSAL